MISHEYGWTTEQILSLTLHEFFWRIKAINYRINQETRFQAALSGKQIKEQQEDIELDKSSEDKINRSLVEHNKKLIEKRIQCQT